MVKVGCKRWRSSLSSPVPSHPSHFPDFLSPHSPPFLSSFLLSSFLSFAPPSPFLRSRAPKSIWDIGSAVSSPADQGGAHLPIIGAFQVQIYAFCGL